MLIHKVGGSYNGAIELSDWFLNTGGSSVSIVPDLHKFLFKDHSSY